MERKEILKDIIERIHRGENLQKIKKEFEEKIGDVSPLEIAKVEEELIKEGIPREKIHSLCDLHVEIFRESLDRMRSPLPDWHPLKILMKEHSIILDIVKDIRNKTKEVEGIDIDDIKNKTDLLRQSGSHYLREENVLFPYIEKHGITQPPAIMWSEHENIRTIEKNLFSILDKKIDRKNLRTLEDISTILIKTLSSHFYKENNILFPAAHRVIQEDEWLTIREEFDEIGYPEFLPKVSNPSRILEKKEKRNDKDMIDLDTGELSEKEIRAILDTLPIDITFVDKEDTVRYFNKSDERVFTRTKAVIGRKVQMCHPQKSIHIVNKILDDFRSGKRDVAEFWIDLNGRKIYIRYFAVRDENGEYLGTLEVTQDITEIKNIEGEKRLLDD